MDPFTIAMLALAGIPRLVDAFESLFSTKKKSGKRKKKLLMETTKAGLTLGKVSEEKQVLILNAVDSLTDMVVKELNEAEPKDTEPPKE